MINIIDKSSCTGCTACYNICPKKCIEMVEDDEGFDYPKVNLEQCIDCGLCKKICPIINCHSKSMNVKAYSLFNINEEIRMESTSGGFFSILADYVLSNGGIVYGAVYDNNFSVKHIAVKKSEELYKLRGAKYAQSNLGDVFKDIKDILNENYIVLFSGTSCQVEGLKAYLGKKYDNLLTVDFICHGVPSPKVWEKYVKYRSHVDNDGILPRRVNLRSKRSGWSNYNYSVVFEYQDSEYIKKSNEDIFIIGFVNDIFLRPSCYNCHFKGFNRNSDFTLGDFWGIWEQCPEMDDNKGTSLVWTNTEEGLDLFSKLSSSFISREFDVLESTKYNQSAVVSSQINKNRKKFFNKLLRDKNFENNLISCLYKLNYREKIAIFLKSMISCLKGIKK